MQEVTSINSKAAPPAADIIHNETGITLSFWERVRVLFGKQIIVNLEMHADTPGVTITKTTARIRVNKFRLPRRKKVMPGAFIAEST